MTENKPRDKYNTCFYLKIYIYILFTGARKVSSLTPCRDLSILEAKAIADFSEVMFIYNYITVIRLGAWGLLLLLLLPVYRCPAPCHLPTCLQRCVDISRLLPTFIFIFKCFWIELNTILMIWISPPGTRTFKSSQAKWFLSGSRSQRRSPSVMLAPVFGWVVAP